LGPNELDSAKDFDLSLFKFVKTILEEITNRPIFRGTQIYLLRCTLPDFRNLYLNP